MKTLNEMITEAEMDWNDWNMAADDEKELKERHKTREEALQLANFFEGRFDGLVDASLYMIRAIKE